MAAQIEVGVVCEVDWGALVAGGLVLHCQPVLHQSVRDLASQPSRVTLVPVGTDQAEILNDLQFCKKILVEHDQAQVSLSSKQLLKLVFVF